MLRLAATALFLVLSLPDPASAQTEEPAEDPEDRREARALFDLAHAHYDAGRYAEAAAEFQRVYELTHRPELLYNLHLAYRDAGDVAGAARALRAYLEQETSVEPAQRRALERRLAAMEEALASRARSSGEPVAEPVERDASAEADDSASEDDAREVADASDTLPAGAAVELGTPVQPDDGFDPTVGAIVVGLAGATAIASAVAGGVAAATAADRDAACSVGPAMDACPAGYDQSAAVATFGSARDAAWGLGITAGVAAVTGVVLVIVGATDDATNLSAGCGPAGCGALLRGRF